MPTPDTPPVTADVLWTQDQVDSLNAFQAAGVMHPFTCGGEGCREVLRATTSGWVCPSCGYRQFWAHDFMITWAWKRLAEGMPWLKNPNP